MKRLSLTAALAATLFAGAASAADLTMAYSDPVSALDPQLNNHAGDHNVSQMFFATLTPKDVNGPVPYLAESWTLIDDKTWEFKLRETAKWSDGQPVTGEDVKFSYERAKDVPGSVASYRGFVRSIELVEVIDPKTIRIHTNVPNPLLPVNLSTVYVISKHAGAAATTEDYNSGKAMVGEGPYVWQGYVPGDRVTMTRNEEFWGPKPAWEKVTYRYIGNPAARTAALLAGDVDAIDKVSLSDLEKLRGNDAVEVFDYPGLRVLLLQPSFNPAPNEFITDKSGAPLAKNPLTDQRVREALNIAINRDAIAERIMRGGATVASQWMPEGTFGYDPDTGPIAADPARAKALLAEAGYPEGFRLTMHVPSDRYPQGPETAQAVAQFWTRIGVETQVEVVPYSVYGSRANKNEYAMTMIGWGNGTGEGSYAMTTILATVNPEKGTGASNWGHYSSARHDELLAAASSEFDDAKREALIRDAVKVVAADVGVIPLFHYKNIWAARKGLKVAPWTSDRWVPMQVTTE
ncbi:ABC transporter substrate-binding protein [Paenirhodobacter sp.]|uniref:ABC transporter substrate-binding protein n=1 Tax=Paenirhodobacter sp. TaxID=1965326 RepID=UPI003B3C2462